MNKQNLVDQLLENWAHWHMQSASPVPVIAQLKYETVGGIYDAEDEQERKASRFAVVVADALFVDNLLKTWDKGSKDRQWYAILIRHRYSQGYQKEAEDVRSSVMQTVGANVSVSFIERTSADARAVIVARYQTR